MIRVSKRSSHLNIINLLDIPSDLRNDKQVAAITAFLAKVPFFRQFMNTKVSRELSANLRVAHVPVDAHVFKFGDKSESFYYIIEGRVEVKVPCDPAGNPIDDPVAMHHSSTQWKTVEIISKGGTFGELGLLVEKPRAATVRALEDTVLALCDKKTYMSFIRTNEQLKIMKLATEVEQVLPSKIDINKLVKLSYYMTSLKFNLGDKIFEEGEHFKYLYLILGGETKVS